MKKQEIVDLILTSGSPSQKYIIKRDILDEDRNNSEMFELQDKILNLKETRTILKNQNNDGWFGVYLHGGTDAMDGSVSRLRALGVEPHHDFMIKAKKALYSDEYPTKAYRTYPPVEEYNFSRAQTLANLHIEGEEPDKLLIKFQNHLIDKFQRGSHIVSLDEVSREIKSAKFIGSRAYLPDKDFPWVCDFIVLGSSLNWKTMSSVNIITAAMKNVARLAPIPPIFDYYNHHYVAPICGYDNFDDYEDCCELPKGRIVFWLNDYNYLCKICDIKQLPYYFRQAEKLAERVKNDTFISALSDTALKAIESIYGYSGKWKTETQKIVDIYYKVLHILHNADIEP
jgi:hypothetical protein